MLLDFPWARRKIWPSSILGGKDLDERADQGKRWFKSERLLPCLDPYSGILSFIVNVRSLVI